MKICTNKLPHTLATTHVSFKRQSNTVQNPYKTDCFNSKNVNILNYEITPAQRIKHLTFSKPLHVTEALQSIILSQNEELLYAFLNSFHPVEELTNFFEDLEQVPELSNVKVKSLLGIGSFALAFETDDSKILKITEQNHFFQNRKPDFFDLPIIKQGQKNTTHYYLEEKVSIGASKEELTKFIQKIEESGYELRDYLVKNYAHANEKKEYKYWQFGKTKDGKLYLIDPGCAIAPPKRNMKISKIKQYLRQIFKIL